MKLSIRSLFQRSLRRIFGYAMIRATSSTCPRDVTSSNCASIHAATILPGTPFDAIRPDSNTFVSSTTLIRRRGVCALSATVSNAGDGESAATTLRYYRSTDATITTSDAQVGTDSVGALAASGTSAESISLTAPATAGAYHYGACVDAVTDESDTTDNCSSSVAVTVTDAARNPIHPRWRWPRCR